MLDLTHGMILVCAGVYVYTISGDIVTFTCLYADELFDTINDVSSVFVRKSATVLSPWIAHLHMASPRCLRAPGAFIRSGAHPHGWIACRREYKQGLAARVQAVARRLLRNARLGAERTDATARDEGCSLHGAPELQAGRRRHREEALQAAHLTPQPQAAPKVGEAHGQVASAAPRST